MRRSILILFALGYGVALPAQILPSNGPRPAAPSEKIWHPAATPKGGVAWATLESTKEVALTDRNGFVHTTPAFSGAVKALAGKRVRVSGYMMPLQNGEKQSHFVLLAYPPDCPFHLNPAAYQFIEIKSQVPLPFSNDVFTLEGTFLLSGQDGSGVFYRILDGRPV